MAVSGWSELQLPELLLPIQGIIRPQLLAAYATPTEVGPVGRAANEEVLTRLRDLFIGPDGTGPAPPAAMASAFAGPSRKVGGIAMTTGDPFSLSTAPLPLR